MVCGSRALRRLILEPAQVANNAKKHFLSSGGLHFSEPVDACQHCVITEVIAFSSKLFSPSSPGLRGSSLKMNHCLILADAQRQGGVKLSLPYSIAMRFPAQVNNQGPVLARDAGNF